MDGASRYAATSRWRRCARPTSCSPALLDHDPGNNAPANLAALCQRCQMRHDAAEYRWQRWWNRFRRRAIGDLYEDPRVTRGRLVRIRHPRHQHPVATTPLLLDRAVAFA